MEKDTDTMVRVVNGMLGGVTLYGWQADHIPLVPVHAPRLDLNKKHLTPWATDTRSRVTNMVMPGTTKTADERIGSMLSKGRNVRTNINIPPIVDSYNIII